MNSQRQWLLALLLPGALLGLWAAVTGAMVWATLDANEQLIFGTVLASRLALVLLAWVIASAGLAVIAQRWFERYVVQLRRMAEGADALLGDPDGKRVAAQGSAPAQALARTVNALADQRSGLQRDMQAHVRNAALHIERERNRLATLMAELTHSVVVCNLDGRVILYNQRARMQFRALVPPEGQPPDTMLMGLGRSIYGVLDQRLVDHALEHIRALLVRGVDSPSAQFVTSTASGQLLRAHMAAVLEPVVTPLATGTAPAIDGFVVILENVTREFEQEALRDQLLHALTEGSRGSLANLQAAAEMLQYDDVDATLRERFLAVIRVESATLSARIQTLAEDSARGLKTRWPMQDMLGADLLSAVVRRVQADGGPALLAEPVDAALWLKIDSFSIIQAVAHLAGRLAQEYGLRHAGLRLEREGAHARLDLIWTGPAMNSETAMGWELDPMRSGTGTTALTVRDVVQRHAGAFWFERDRARQTTLFRFLLPLAGTPEMREPDDTRADTSRPEYYDFDLFRNSEQAQALEDRRLDSLSYTVFDTETTGLDPSGGDQIIQIGAVRIVNGRLLRHETFDQLVDPHRPIGVAALAVHGITQAMVAGQPAITSVLPAFHQYAQDTVLVAHNAAFDMRFLQCQELASGVRFDHPVLDTLLLSAALQPHQESHSLEALAERFGVAPGARHTALGDASVTAQVFLKLLPLLAHQGIHTLGQARSAARRTWYARLQY